ncbi:MAG: hypothetical protein MR051_08555 [Lentisphaeria bacterium]|nr:hypothetical protein [Lentisphaeria bacterium]
MKRYTLNELVVTVAVGAVGLALLATAADGAKSDARSTACQSMLKKYGAAFASYAGTFNDFLPAGFTPNSPSRSMRWENAIQPLLENGRFMRCPANTPQSTGFGANYCYNVNINAKLPFHFFDPVDPGKSKLSKYSRQLPQIVLIGDAVRYTCVSPRQLGCRPVRDVSGDGIKDSARGADYNNYAPMRHDGNWNYVAADGSVRSISFAEWQTNMNNSGIFYDAQFDL